MSDINRKLVTIEKVISVEKHPNADTLDLIGIRGWTVISKSGQYKVGDLVLYYEADSFLPVDPRYEFLRKSSFKSTKNLGDGFRLKTMKLRGEISQGLILPLSEFFSKIGNIWVYSSMGGTISLQEGDDVTEILNIQKYEKPIPSNLAGIARGNFPSFIPKTDQERWQNLSKNTLEKYKDTMFEATTKMDGSSMTVYLLNEENFGVCSRNIDLKDDVENNFKTFNEPKSENLFWKLARQKNLKEILKYWYSTTGQKLALQFELCGPGIQDNPQKLKEHDIFLFDIYNIEEKRYLNSLERIMFCGTFNLNHVPIVNSNLIFREEIFNKSFISKMANEVKYNNIPAEGLVFKSIDGKFSFKMISDQYLLKEKD